MDRVIDKLNAGSEDAFRYLYDTHVNMVRYLARKYIKDEIQIKDVVQDVFLSLWENRGKITSLPSVKGFLFINVRNRCLNILRHTNIRSAYAGNFTPEQERDFLEKTIETEFAERLMSLYEQLPPQWKAIYKLHLEGKKNEEISEILSIPVNTVKQYKSNANNMMRQLAKDMSMIISILLG